jgi:hypothetical protein
MRKTQKINLFFDVSDSEQVYTSTTNNQKAYVGANMIIKDNSILEIKKFSETKGNNKKKNTAKKILLYIKSERLIIKGCVFTIEDSVCYMYSEKLLTSLVQNETIKKITDEQNKISYIVNKGNKIPENVARAMVFYAGVIAYIVDKVCLMYKKPKLVNILLDRLPCSDYCNPKEIIKAVQLSSELNPILDNLKNKGFEVIISDDKYYLQNNIKLESKKHPCLKVIDWLAQCAYAKYNKEKWLGESIHRDENLWDSLVEIIDYLENKHHIEIINFNNIKPYE